MELLKNKKAVITGGSSGIGKAIAKAYLENGAEVVLLSNGTEALLKTQEELSPLGSIKTVVVDVSRSSDVKRAARDIGNTFETVDILVNAAGVYGPIGHLTDVDPEEWKRALDINLFGVFLSIHHFAPLMGHTRRGCIINFVGGGEGAFPNFSSYVSAKGGIARFTETVAEELKERGIDVNAIAPGAVNTKFLNDLLAAGPEKAGKENYERGTLQKASGGTPPEKAAALCVFLASEKARGITGKILSAVWDPYEHFNEHIEDIKRTDVYTVRRVRPEWRGFDWGERREEK